MPLPSQRPPIRLLVLHEPEQLNGVSWWRLYQPLVALERQYTGRIVVEYNSGYIHPHQLMQADVVFALRPHLSTQYSMLLMAKQHGCRIILDFDDDLYNINLSHPHYLLYREKKAFYLNRQHLEGKDITQETIRECIKLADELWVTTQALKDVYGHPNTTVVPNAVNIHMLPAEPSPSGTQLRIVWRGSVGHICDVVGEQFETGLHRLLEYLPQIYWLGYMPPEAEQSEYGHQVLVPGQDTLAYFNTMRQIAPNVVWKPLRDIPMNRAKSNIAWLEATMFGGVCVGGLNTPEWAFTMPMHELKDKNIRAKTWEASMKEIAQNYNLEKVNQLRLSSLEGK